MYLLRCSARNPQRYYLEPRLRKTWRHRLMSAWPFSARPLVICVPPLPPRRCPLICETLRHGGINSNLTRKRVTDGTKEGSWVRILESVACLLILSLYRNGMKHVIILYKCSYVSWWHTCLCWFCWGRNWNKYRTDKLSDDLNTEFILIIGLKIIYYHSGLQKFRPSRAPGACLLYVGAQHLLVLSMVPSMWILWSLEFWDGF